MAATLASLTPRNSPIVPLIVGRRILLVVGERVELVIVGFELLLVTLELIYGSVASAIRLVAECERIFHGSPLSLRNSSRGHMGPD
jgi:hypothetical protein